MADARCGTKATGLKLLMDGGFAVPDGIVIPDPQSTDWEPELAAALRQLGSGPYAVRSSAAVEDRPDASYAGQLHTSLHLTNPTQVAAAVRRTAISPYAPEARTYAAAMGRDEDGSVSVIVQNMLDPDTAGVIFTRHPVTGAEQVVIEATAGLGNHLVDGSRTPERWVIDGDTVTAPSALDQTALTSEQALTLAYTAGRIEDLFGCPQDTEWAIADGRTWLLQSRPITTIRPTEARSTAPSTGVVLTTGTPASPGIATGPVRIIDGLNDFAMFQSGDVLVCHATSPAWTPLLARAAAVITETGGVLAHAAIVAREFRIPAITTAADPMTALPAGEPVVVDGTAGTVTTSAEGDALPVSTRTPADLRVLHTVRTLGYADAARIATRLDLSETEVTEYLLDAQANGWVTWSSYTGDSSWSLTETGKQKGEQLLAAELDAANARGTVEDVHTGFLPLNEKVSGACTAWQLTEMGIATQPIDLTDIIATLTQAADELGELEERLTRHLTRFGGYHCRFSRAVAHAGTVPGWITATDRDSCHRVWFELHEDLIATLGLTR